MLIRIYGKYENWNSNGWSDVSPQGSSVSSALEGVAYDLYSGQWYVAGGNSLLTSYDGGDTWSEESYKLDGCSISRMKIVEDETIWGAGSKSIFKIKQLYTKKGIRKSNPSSSINKYNIYLTINFDTLSAIEDNNSTNKSDISLKKFNTIENVYLNSSSSLTFENINLNNQEEGSFGKKIISQQLKLDLNDMQKWRFKSKEIHIKKDIWHSQKLFLTNDPFNKPQLLIDNRNFNTSTDKEDIVIKSNWSWLILDDFIKPLT